MIRLNVKRLNAWKESLTPMKLIYGVNYIEFISHVKYKDEKDLERMIDEVEHFPKFKLKFLGKKSWETIRKRVLDLHKKNYEMACDFVEGESMGLNDISRYDHYYHYKMTIFGKLPKQ